MLEKKKKKKQQQQQLELVARSSKTSTVTHLLS